MNTSNHPLGWDSLQISCYKEDPQTSVHSSTADHKKYQFLRIVGHRSQTHPTINQGFYVEVFKTRGTLVANGLPISHQGLPLRCQSERVRIAVWLPPSGYSEHQWINIFLILFEANVEVSCNRGTSKSSIYRWIFHLETSSYGGSHIWGNHRLYI